MSYFDQNSFIISFFNIVEIVHSEKSEYAFDCRFFLIYHYSQFLGLVFELGDVVDQVLVHVVLGAHHGFQVFKLGLNVLFGFILNLHLLYHLIEFYLAIRMLYSHRRNGGITRFLTHVEADAGQRQHHNCCQKEIYHQCRLDDALALNDIVKFVQLIIVLLLFLNLFLSFFRNNFFS